MSLARMAGAFITKAGKFLKGCCCRPVCVECWPTRYRLTLVGFTDNGCVVGDFGSSGKWAGGDIEGTEFILPRVYKTGGCYYGDEVANIFTLGEVHTWFYNTTCAGEPDYIATVTLVFASFSGGLCVEGSFSADASGLSFWENHVYIHCPMPPNRPFFAPNVTSGRIFGLAGILIEPLYD